MAYHFKRRESVSKAVRRLGRKRVKHAIKCLKDPIRAKAIHCARKDIKKVRAVLRLVRSRLKKKDFQRLAALLRNAATLLSTVRDAFVRAQSVQELARHFRGQIAPRGLRVVRAWLRHEGDEAMKRFVRNKVGEKVERMLRQEARRIQELKVDGKEWPALAPGVEFAYRRGRRAYHEALADPTPDNFHRWRKRAKDLWYQVKLLTPIWREQMEAMAAELDTLGECLGDDHDLVILRQHIEQCWREQGHPTEIETLEGLIAQRQHRLRVAALAIGARFYADKPGTFCTRLADYWRAWRHEKHGAVAVIRSV